MIKGKRFSLNQLRDKKMSLLCKGLCLFGLIMLSQQANALFKLQSTGIILQQQDNRADFEITNTTKTPILLVTKLYDLNSEGFSKNIIISPPITRIDPDHAQQVSFVLKKGVKMDHEVLLKASFEGVGIAEKDSAKMPVNQEIGFLVEPASLVVNKRPWEKLNFTISNHKIVINNPSKYVVRMAPNITLLPGNQIITISHFYILPGQQFSFDVKGSPTKARVIPLSRFGFKLPTADLSIS